MGGSKPPQRGCNGEAVSEDEEPPRDKTRVCLQKRNSGGSDGGRLRERAAVERVVMRGRNRRRRCRSAMQI